MGLFNLCNLFHTKFDTESTNESKVVLVMVLTELMLSKYKNRTNACTMLTI